MSVELRRIKVTEKGTISLVLVDHIFICIALERPWINNAVNISCVPSGTYPLELEHSPSFNMKLYELKDVPGRSECKFHVANYLREIKGCMATGNYERIDALGNSMVSESQVSFDRFMDAMKGRTSDRLLVSGIELVVLP